MGGRRRLKRKSDEGDQMSERDSRQSSVRARISGVEEEQTSTPAAGERKRFSYPGKTKTLLSQESVVDHHQIGFTPSSLRSGRQHLGPTTTSSTDYEAHLREVWSVRKNIHHKQVVQSSTNTNSGSKTSILQSTGPGPHGGLTQAEKYSRYGVLPHAPPAEFSSERNRTTAYKDSGVAVETVTPWSLKKPTTSFNSSKYADQRPHPQQHPHPPSLDMATHSTSTSTTTTTTSPPRIKGRGRGGEPARICREDFEPAPAIKRDHTDRVGYAKSMAKGYLRSVGSGEYAPSQSNYIKQSPAPPPSSSSSSKETTTTTVPSTTTQSKWKRADDEFDF